MQYWWDAIYQKDWRQSLRVVLRKFARDKLALQMAEKKIQALYPSVTPNYKEREVQTYTLPNDPNYHFFQMKEKAVKESENLKEHVGTIENVLTILTAEQKSFIEKRYFQRCSRDCLIEEMNLMSESAYETFDNNCLMEIKESLLQISLFASFFEVSGKIRENPS